MVDNARFDVPGIILYGAGCRRQIASLVRELGGTHVLLVTDPGVVELGIVDEVRSLLIDAGLPVTVFSEVQPDPTDVNVDNGFAMLKAAGADIVIALGGGSPIDAGKVIAARCANPAPLPDWMGLHQVAHRGLPFIAVPTTAGTGSEATKVAVITDTTREVKMMMLSAPLLPSAAVVDFELTLSMPRHLTAAVGVDTLTHGIEAYVSRKANGMADPLALSCVRLCATFLRRAWKDSGDREARAGMMLAASHGGMAFSNSSVALVHGMSRPLGAVFHIPHGLSNAVLLPVVTRFSLPAASGRYADIAGLLGCAVDKLPAWLQRLNEDLELPCLSGCRGFNQDVFESKVLKMAEDALRSGSPANNPRVPTIPEIVEIYKQSLSPGV